jgi:hypothetical protein
MDTLKILRLARKKKGLTIRDVNYWTLEDLVHQTLLNKSYPKNKRGRGWPLYTLSRRGRKALERAHQNANKRS